MLISFAKLKGQRKESLMWATFPIIPKIHCLLPFVNPLVKAIPALEEKDTAVLPNPHKGTVDPTHGLKNSQMMTCLQPLHFLGALFCWQHQTVRD